MRATEKRKSTTTARKGRASAVVGVPKVKAKPKLTADQEKTYREFEHALTLLYKQEYDRARAEFETLRGKYAHERDLADRARIYLNVCQARTVKSRGGEGADPYMQALIQYNEGEYEEALRLLEKASRQDPNDARVVYLTACARLAHGDREEGLRLLRESIRLDAANRYRALNDPDLEEIRTAEDFVDSLGDEEPGA